MNRTRKPFGPDAFRTAQLGCDGDGDDFSGKISRMLILGSTHRMCG